MNDQYIFIIKNNSDVYHIDRNRSNNYLYNLKVAIQSKNINNRDFTNVHKRAIIQYDLSNNIINKYDSIINTQK